MRRGRRLTPCRLVVGDDGVRTNGFVLPVDEDPQPDLGLGVVEVLRDALLEHAICLVLQHAEGGQIRGGPVPLVEGGDGELVLGVVFLYEVEKDRVRFPAKREYRCDFS